MFDPNTAPMIVPRGVRLDVVYRVSPIEPRLESRWLDLVSVALRDRVSAEVFVVGEVVIERVGEFGGGVTVSVRSDVQQEELGKLDDLIYDGLYAAGGQLIMEAETAAALEAKLIERRERWREASWYQ